jgi:hypothetical protein
MLGGNRGVIDGRFCARTMREILLRKFLVTISFEEMMEISIEETLMVLKLGRWNGRWKNILEHGEQSQPFGSFQQKTGRPRGGN